jgi:hypothetical protein
MGSQPAVTYPVAFAGYRGQLHGSESGPADGEHNGAWKIAIPKADSAQSRAPRWRRLRPDDAGRGGSAERVMSDCKGQASRRFESAASGGTGPGAMGSRNRRAIAAHDGGGNQGPSRPNEYVAGEQCGTMTVLESHELRRQGRSRSTMNCRPGNAAFAWARDFAMPIVDTVRRSLLAIDTIGDRYDWRSIRLALDPVGGPGRRIDPS